MTTIYFIYKITNKLNGKIYIGQHKTNNIDDGYMGSGIHLKNAIEKHGIENFEREILCYADDEDHLDLLEREFVDEEFVLREDTYNMVVGGGKGWSAVHTSEGREYTRKLWQERLGVDHMMESDYYKNLRKEIVKKKYGVENVFQLDSVKEKIKQTNLERYGVESYSQTKEFRDKAKQTSLEKYGAEHYSQTEEGKNRIKETCIERFGCHPNQRKEIRNMHRSRMAGNQITKGMKHIKRGTENKMCHPDELEDYLADGWVNTSHAKGSKWVNKDGVSKMVPADQLEQHLEDGWGKGRGKINRNNL